MSAASTYVGSLRTADSADVLDALTHVKDAKLRNIVADVINNDSDKTAVRRLGAWCKAHYPKVKKIKTAAFAPTVTTINPSPSTFPHSTTNAPITSPPTTSRASTTTTTPRPELGDSGLTAANRAEYLAQLATDPNLAKLTVDQGILLGNTLCLNLDQGSSIDLEAQVFIGYFKTLGLNSTNAEMAFYTVATAAADDGDFSFCYRHSAQVEKYDKTR